MPIIAVIILVLLAALAIRLDMSRAATPRCGDCGLRMSPASGTCPACGGRRV